MDSFLYTNIPVQIISYTDTDGKITPMRFRFTDRDGQSVTVKIDRIISTDRKPNNLGVSYECSAESCGALKRFYLYYSGLSGIWLLSHLEQ